MQESTGTRAELDALLRRYNEFPPSRAEVLAAIERQFTRHRAILVLDSSGFSRTTRAMGIVHFLALLERLERTVRPLVEASDGRILKTEADNVYAVFVESAHAVRAAVRIQEALRAANEMLPSDEEIDAAIGIGFGPVLVVGTDDVFGDEMNLACKLGEDLAQRAEILMTSSAREALDEVDLPLDRLDFSISGISFPAFRLRWQETP
ncbi:MAG: adenylate/guanylate cyclase domain-containing protein [Chloroflexi bacterium]|nr:adenylate/guanylate cyclase domain-containing protein [Chloroflexota bacterium]